MIGLSWQRLDSEDAGTRGLQRWMKTCLSWIDVLLALAESAQAGLIRIMKPQVMVMYGFSPLNCMGFQKAIDFGFS